GGRIGGVNRSPRLDHFSVGAEFDHRRGWGAALSQAFKSVVLGAGGHRAGPRRNPDMVVLGDIDRADDACGPAVRQRLWPVRVITKRRDFIAGAAGRFASLLRPRDSTTCEHAIRNEGSQTYRADQSAG